MPKHFIARIAVPSRSRPSAVMGWMNNLFKKHSDFTVEHLNDGESLTKDETVAIHALLTLIHTGRVDLSRKGEPVDLTPEEKQAILKLRTLLSRLGSVIHVG